METTQESKLALEGDIIQKPGATDDFELRPAPLQTPFKKIALALSGGGFRAAAYSLGTMSYLNHLKYPDGTTNDRRMLGNVEFISSASGGTFAGILYSMHVRQGKPFAETYKKLLTFMNGETLLEDVLKLINDDSEWTKGRSRNFINAFARVYNNRLFDKATFGVYWPQNNQAPERMLEVCFNTTEFYRGLSFRFQAGSNGGSIGNTGNAYVYFDKRDESAVQTLQKIRLGDIMASSSCFPGGFEPILYPKDFAYGTDDNGVNPAELKNALVIEDYNNTASDYKKDIGFMDGGIDDNQGIYSAMLADRRRRSKNTGNGFDLIFATDVASYFMDAYVAPEEDQSANKNETLCSITAWCDNGIRKAKNLVKTVIIISAILFVAGLLLLLAAPSLLPHDLVLIITSIAATVLIITFIFNKRVFGLPLLQRIQYYLGLSDAETVQLLKKESPALQNFSDTALDSLVHHLKNAPLAVLKQMLKARLNSMLTLVMDVNLKQTRRLIFDQFYGNFYGSDVWGNRRVFNVIYELSTFNQQSRSAILKRKFNDPKYKLPIGKTGSDTWAADCIQTLTTGCEELAAKAEIARTMGTTLWFDKEDADTNRMRTVVACGEFTTCAKLLEYAMIVDRLLQIQELSPGIKRMIDFDPTQLAIFRSVKTQLESDWQAFKKDPYYIK